MVSQAADRGNADRLWNETVAPAWECEPRRNRVRRTGGSESTDDEAPAVGRGFESVDLRGLEPLTP
ncbi:hypothetical protein GCM10023152_18720 [Agromyces bauzanensis]|uniref:Uncharacterized protein n=1 Tax=Agromyces bauzanensis TaxID=1308924 RepID=A0A917PGC3_9MICO|nr:hypothetical protein GCM10011372_13780 [Agromyces bauzanensis]